MTETTDQADAPQPMQDDLIRALTSPRRQYLLLQLSDSDGEAPLDDLAEQIANHELDAFDGPVSDEVTERMLAALYHVHIPLLVEVGLVEYTDDERTVALTRAVSEDWLLPYAGHLLLDGGTADAGPTSERA